LHPNDMSLRDALNSANENTDRRRAPPGPSYGTGKDADALAAFDAADGKIAIPAGWYRATVLEGGLVVTKSGKMAYRLTFSVAEGPHAGHRLWRWYSLDTRAANFAKAALEPLGIANSSDLKRPYPGPDRVVAVRVLVGVQTRPDGLPGNDILRIDDVSIETNTPNPNAVDPKEHLDAGGGA
jgi:hypothetical protein